jgi:hypothetical protein
MEGIVAIAILSICFVTLFAQARLFSIDQTLKDIRDELRTARNDESAPTDSGDQLVRLKL